MNLTHEFKNYVSSGAFKRIDGEIRIIGKYGQISLINDIFDIWIITPDLKQIPERKLSFILKRFPKNSGYTRLCGEAWVQTKDKELVLNILSVLKIRKRKKLSKHTTTHLLERLDSANSEFQNHHL